MIIIRVLLNNAINNLKQVDCELTSHNMRYYMYYLLFLHEEVPFWNTTVEKGHKEVYN